VYLSSGSKLSFRFKKEKDKEKKGAVARERPWLARYERGGQASAALARSLG
jgi:hypothetical protein